MNCFELIRNVLDELWQEIPGTTDAEKAEQVKARQSELSRNYAAIRGSSVIDYSDPLTQFAYIFTYTAAHGDFLYQLLNKVRRKHDFPEQGEFSLTSLGGGPGSDLIGCLKFFDKHSASGLAFSANSFDKDNDWSLCWANVASCIARDDSAEQVCKSLSPSFHNLNVTDDRASAKIKKFMNADMFSMIYFMSEVIKTKNESSTFFEFFFKNVKKGSIVTFIDNKMDDVYGWFDQLVADNGFDVLASGEEEWVASSHEEKTELKKYMGLLNYTPKVRGRLAFRVVRKK